MQQSETPPSERFRIEVETALRAHELVSTLLGEQGKRKERRMLGRRTNVWKHVLE